MNSDQVIPDKNAAPNVSDPEKSSSESSSSSSGKLSGPGFGRTFRFIAFAVFFLLVIVPLGIRQGFESFLFSVITFFEVILLFNILIIVHELGHFLAAKWCGLKIDKFAIWFGNPLWAKKIDGVEYVFGSIPAGGYVALPQMAPMEAIEGKTETPREELPPASPWQKIVVAFAGPLFSFGLAVVFASIVWAVGKPTTYSEKTTIIGYVAPDGPAAKAGLHTGDVIKSINGHPVSRWMGVGNGVTWCIVTSTVSPLTIVVDRDGQELPFQVKPEVDPDQPHHWYQRNSPPVIKIAADEKDIIVSKTLPNSPAALAGLQKGDRLVALDDVPLRSSYAIYSHLQQTPDAPLNFTIIRGGQTLQKAVRPEKPISPPPADIPKGEPQTDIGLAIDDNVDVVLDHPTPWNQIAESIDMVRSTLLALLTPHSNVSPSQLSGPVGIMNILFAVLSSENGWRMALWLAVVINVNLALLNLFPLPVLDGGHILLSIIESIRRRPLSMAILEPLQTACALVLICYMAYITCFDLQDSAHMAMAREEKFAPKTASP
ncbi:MAG TPA: RIP metalloprotease RseP [Candidatus Methylacidiphilales bacterium]|nr:RIP metalloprotease RseP [Candidatus Methylacidiphilales bacterium]